MLAQLPKKKLLQRVNGDVVHYVCADPKGCNCIDVGDRQAYQSYRQQRQQQSLVDAAQNVDVSYSDVSYSDPPGIGARGAASSVAASVTEGSAGKSTVARAGAGGGSGQSSPPTTSTA